MVRGSEGGWGLLFSYLNCCLKKGYTLFFYKEPFTNKFYNSIEAQNHQRTKEIEENGKVEAQENFKYSYKIKRVYCL